MLWTFYLYPYYSTYFMISIQNFDINNIKHRLQEQHFLNTFLQKKVLFIRKKHLYLDTLFRQYSTDFFNISLNDISI